MTLYSRVRELPLTVESYRLETEAVDVSPDFVRKTTVVRLQGSGHEGVGEDVTYDPTAHEALAATDPSLPLTGSWTLQSLSSHLDTVPLWDEEPRWPASREYRRWAYESAALDLALRQNGLSLADAVERRPEPVTFVVSPRSAIREWLEVYPCIRFKLDAGDDWDEETVAGLAASGAVLTVDLKGHYRGTPVDLDADAALYRRVAEGFPQAWIEDPWLTEETDAVLRAHRDRITWDAPIHSVADVESLPFPPRALNCKPSRFGTLQRLFDFYDYTTQRGIALYGGGQFELGPGRGQIQLLASLFHSGGPNDVAPVAYNVEGPRPGLPTSPLTVTPDAVGFRTL